LQIIPITLSRKAYFFRSYFSRRSASLRLNGFNAENAEPMRLNGDVIPLPILVNPNFKLEPINFIPFVILPTFDNAPVIPDPMFESIFDINAILDWPGKFFKFLFIRLNYVYINDCNTLKLDATVES
jgi:hypothetical protein